MRRVYVVNNGGHDYSQAEQFGEVVFCTEGMIDRLDISRMYRELETALRDAYAEDYIVITSLTSLCCVATSIMAAKFGEVHLLLYSNGGYEVRDLVLDN